MFSPGVRHSSPSKGVAKLTLNDASVTVEPEMSSALGNGLKCGFLGLLHMEVHANHKNHIEIFAPEATDSSLLHSSHLPREVPRG